MTRRPAFTLLEVLLALGIALLLMGGLYVSMDIQVRLTQAGRVRVDESTVARAVLARITADVAGALTPLKASGSASSATTDTTASAAGSATGTASATTDSGTTAAVTTSSAVMPFSCGVQGDISQLVLYVSRVPGASPAPDSDAAPGGGPDVRRVTYWLAGDRGLARQEICRVTADDPAAALPPDVPNEDALVVSPEVIALEFRYFDGTAWKDNWDGITPGGDGATPVGPPRAVKISLQIRSAADPGRTRMYHHVVAVQSANAPPPEPTTAGGTGP